MKELSEFEQRQEIAVTLGYDPDDPESWPVALMAGLMHIRRHDGDKEYQAAISRELRSRTRPEPTLYDIERKIDALHREVMKVAAALEAKQQEQEE